MKRERNRGKLGHCWDCGTQTEISTRIESGMCRSCMRKRWVIQVGEAEAQRIEAQRIESQRLRFVR
jgi:hypothetical protein